MQSLFFVVSTPRLQLFASIFQRQEPVRVQALAGSFESRWPLEKVEPADIWTDIFAALIEKG
jgi:hypothetical protein